MERRNFFKKGAALSTVFAAGTVTAMAKENNLPTAGESIFNVQSFGAAGDANTIDTKAIQSAIDKAAGAGGGIVFFPAGTYLAGTLNLKSNITLMLTEGAVLKASPKPEDFPRVAKSYSLSDMKKGEKRCHFLFTKDAKNITICGGGRIDGNFKAHRQEPKAKYTWFGQKHPDHKINPMIEWVNCKNITIENIDIKDSPGWNCHFYMCDNIVADHVRIRNHLYSGHSDGFDISGCHFVKISNCDISTGDDAIVFKTPRMSRSCEKIVITNCILRSTCAAVKLGTGSWHAFKQITFNNSVVHQSSRAFQMTIFDGGDVEDVTVSNIVCDTNAGVTLARPIHLDTHRRRDNKTGELLHPEHKERSTIKNVVISNIVLRTAGRILMTAEDGCKIRNVILRDIQMEYPWIEDPEMVKDLSDAMQGSNYSPESRIAKAAVVAKNIDHLQLSGLMITWPYKPVPDDFLPVYEHGKEVIDPRTTEIPLPVFNAFWGRNIDGGMLDIPLAKASEDNKNAVDLAESDVHIR